MESNIALQKQLKRGYMREFEEIGHFFYFLGKNPLLYINKVLEDIKRTEYRDEYIKYHPN